MGALVVGVLALVVFAVYLGASGGLGAIESASWAAPAAEPDREDSLRYRGLEQMFAKFDHLEQAK